MKKVQVNALLEALKELVRVVLIAIIPVLIDSLNKGTVNWNVILVVGAIAGLRAIEKFLYEYKPTNDNPVTNFLKFG